MATRAATATTFGFDFQANAAIVIMLDNIKEMRSIRLEGEEDIELILEDGSYILAQAKAVEKSSSDFSHVTKNYKKALASLADGEKNCGTNNVKQLIFVTNSPRPLGGKQNDSIFYGASFRPYDSLPLKYKNLINNAIIQKSVSISLNKYAIQVIPFETDNDKERYKVITDSIREFMSKSGIIVSAEGLQKLWAYDLFVSGAKKNQNIKLNKKDIIWPIIVTIVEKPVEDDGFDESSLVEIKKLYSDLIDTCSEQYSFFTRVLADYNVFGQNIKNPNQRKEEFCTTKFSNYSDLVDDITSLDQETKDLLLQVIVRNILNKRIQINKIKEAVNL